MTTTAVDLVLLAKAVEFQYKLDTYTEDQLKTILAVADKSEKELTKILSNAKITDWNKERTGALLEEVQDLQLAAKAKITGVIADTSATAGSAAYEAHSKSLSFGGDASNVAAVAMTAEVMRSMIVTTPVGGKLLSEWVDKTFSSNMKDKIKMEIAAGLINGDSYPALTKRLKEGWPGTKRELETLTKTYVASVNSQAMQDVFEANKDIIKWVQWRAAMSNRTCLRCAGLDGQKYKIENHPALPLHPNCRCTLLPITDADALGLSNKAVQKAARPYSIKEGKIVGLGGKGKTIDAGTWEGNYESWLNQLTPKQQRDFLGPKRLEMIQKGEVSFNDLVDKKTGRIRTLEELPGYREKVKEATAKAVATKASMAAEKAAVKALDEAIKKSAASASSSIMKAAEAEAVLQAARKAATVAAEKAVKEAAEKAAKEMLESSMRSAAAKTTSSITKAAEKAVVQGVATKAAKEAAEKSVKEALAKIEAEKLARLSEAALKGAATKRAKKEAAALAIKAEEDAAKAAALKEFYRVEREKAAKRMADEALKLELFKAEARKTQDAAKALREAEDAATVAKERYVAAMMAGETPASDDVYTWMSYSTDKERLSLKAKLAKRVEAEKVITDAKERYMAAMITDEFPDPDDLLTWVHHSTKEESSYLKAKLARIEAKKIQAASKVADTPAKKIPEPLDADKIEAKKARAKVKRDKAAANKLASEEAARKAAARIETAMVKEDMLDGDDFKLYKEQAGSNEGGFYVSKANPDEKYYFKFPASESHVDNEILAAKLYKATGVQAPDLLEVKMNGRRGVASRIVDDLKESKSAITSGKYAASIEEGFAVDAWLANWDVVGTGYNNLLMKGGEAYRIDVGGSLLYRARGGPKGSLFGDVVNELGTFLDKSRNPYSAEVFGNITREQIEAGVRKIIAISDTDIRRFVDRHGPTARSLKNELAETLIARKKYLLEKYPNAAYPPGKAPKVKVVKPKPYTGEVVERTKLNIEAYAHMDKDSVAYIDKLKRSLSEREFQELEKMVKEVMDGAKVGVRFEFGSGKPGTVKGITGSGRLLNQFQLGSKADSGGSLCPYKGGSRDGWEKNIGGGAYQKNPGYKALGSRDYFDNTAMADERPTYGFVYRDGVKSSSASQYGNVVATFGDDVKKATTMTAGNSSSISASDAMGNAGSVGSFDNPGPIFRQIRNKGVSTLDRAWEAVEGYSYTEVQIHSSAGLDIARAKSFVIDKDMLRRYASSSKELDMVVEQVKELSRRYNVPWGFMGEDLIGIHK